MKTNNLPNLNESVLAALDFFSKNQPAHLNLDLFRMPIVVGSGNAYNTGQAIFGSRPAIIASESNFKQILSSYQDLIKNQTIKQVLVISASGEKDSIWEIELAKKNKLHTTLLTCNALSTGAKLADRVLVYEKLPEPYTYNTSTYLGMFLGASKEKPENIKKFLKHLKLPKNFKNYKAFSFILPDEFSSIGPMIEIKRHELFGPHLSLRAFTYGEARHAKFVNEWDKELVISLGKNKYFGLPQARWEIKLPSQVGLGFIMALTYYIVGQIQKDKPAYYRKNINHFCQEGPKAYGSKNPFPLIVK